MKNAVATVAGMNSDLVLGKWTRGAHSIPLVHANTECHASYEAVVLNADHYFVPKPLPGFDLDLIYELYLHPDNVNAWRRKAIGLLDVQFGADGQQGVVLFFKGQASLSRVNAFLCSRITIDGARFLRADKRLTVTTA
jgi:hypothetical protein